MAEAVTSVVITARDDTAGAFASLQSKFAGLQGGISSAKAALGTLAGALSIGAIEAWASSVTEAASSLDKLHKATGSSVEDLSRVSNAARVAGVESGEFSAILYRMAAAMGGAGKGAKEAQEGLKLLGITTRDPAKALVEVAKSLDQYADGVEKAALTRAIFLRSGPEFNALLHDMAEAQTVAATVTAKQAEEAEKLEKQFRTLKVESTTLANVFLNDLVPALAEAAKNFNLARQSGFGFFESIARASATNAAVALDKLDDLKETLNAVDKEIAKVQATKFKFSDGGLAQLVEQRTKLLGEIAKFQRYVLAFNSASDVADTQLPPGMKGAAPSLPDAAKVDELAKAMERLRKSSAASQAELLALTSQTRDFVPAERELAEIMASDVWKTAPESWKQQYLALAKVVIATQQQTKSFDALGKAASDYADARAKERAEFEKQQSDVIAQTDAAVKAYTESTDAAERELSVIGASDDARQKLVATLQYEAEKRKIVAATTVENAATMQAETKVLDEQYQRRIDIINKTFAQQNYLQLYNSISDGITDAILRGFESGHNVIQSFIDELKRVFAQLVLRPIIQASVAPIAGSLSGVASAAGIGSGLTGANLLGAASGSGLQLGIESFLINRGLTDIAKLVTPVMAALPWAALATIAIPAIAKIFDKGPASRTGTFASGNLGSDRSRDAIFSASSAFGAFGIAKDFWLGPEAGQAFKPTLDAITALDNTIAKLVGTGTTQQITAALAQHSITVGLGKEGTDINASGGPAQILKDRYVTVLSVIDKQLGRMVEQFQGTGEELAKFVAGLVALHEGLTEPSLADTLDQIAKSSGGTFQSLLNVASGLRSLIENFDGSATAVDNLTSATDAYRQAEYALIAQIEEVRKSIDSMFGDTLRNLQLQTLDPADKYAFLTDEINSLYEQALAASDPATVKMLADRINSDINDAFGLLDPESQKSKIGEFLSNTGSIQQGLNERLTAIETDVHQSVADTLAEISTKLSEVAAKFGTSADTNLQAANLQLEAALTPITVDVGGRSEVNGG